MFIKHTPNEDAETRPIRKASLRDLSAISQRDDVKKRMHSLTKRSED